MVTQEAEDSSGFCEDLKYNFRYVKKPVRLFGDLEKAR